MQTFMQNVSSFFAGWAASGTLAAFLGYLVYFSRFLLPVTAIAVISWVAGSAGLIHNGRRMRYVAWASWTINAVMPLALFFVADDVVARVSPWFSGGATYFYVSTVGAIVSLAWLAWSAPSQIAARNGG